MLLPLAAQFHIERCLLPTMPLCQREAETCLYFMSYYWISVCAGIICLSVCFTHTLCSTPRQMGVICHNGWASGWWSESISRVNADRELGPASTKTCSGEGRRGEWINQWSDWKGSKSELSFMNIHYWVEAQEHEKIGWKKERIKRSGRVKCAKRRPEVWWE